MLEFRVQVDEPPVTGVLQALNKHVGVFIDEDAELLSALGGQAAGAIENALLHDEINRLFEGFVSASVVAIDPFIDGCRRLWRRYVRIGLGLLFIYALTAAACLLYAGTRSSASAMRRRMSFRFWSFSRPASSR